MPFVVIAPQPASLVRSPGAASLAALAAFSWHLQTVAWRAIVWAIPMCAAQCSCCSGVPGGPSLHQQQSSGPGTGSASVRVLCLFRWSSLQPWGTKRLRTKDDTVLLFKHLAPRLCRSGTWCSFGSGGSLRQTKSRRLGAESTKLSWGLWAVTRYCYIYLSHDLLVVWIDEVIFVFPIRLTSGIW